MRARLVRVAGGGLLVVVALVAIEAGRAALAEARSFHPRRGPVAVPPSLAGIEAMRDVTFHHPGGGTVHGWVAPSHNGAAIVLAHGSGADRAQVAGEFRILQGAGFGVLAFDWPGNGESEGRVTFGQVERDALRAAVSKVASLPDVDPSRIGALGFSVGAALLATEAARDDRIHALVLVAPFADSDEQTSYEFGRWGPVTAWPPIWVDHLLMPDGPLRPVDAVRDLAGRSLLIVEGTGDHVVPPWMTDEVYAAAHATTKDLFVVPGADHMDLEAHVDGGYGLRVVQFFENSLARPVSSSRSP